MREVSSNCNRVKYFSLVLGGWGARKAISISYLTSFLVKSNFFFTLNETL